MKSIYLFRDPIFLVTYFIGIAIALFSPLDILVQMPWIKDVSGPLSQIFPPIKFYIDASRFPQITECYFTFMWLVAPLHYYWCGKALRQDLQAEAQRKSLEKIPLRDRVATIIGQVIVLFWLPIIIYYYLFLNQGYEFSWMPISKSQTALAFGGLIYAGSLAWMALRVEVLALEKLFSFFKDVFSKGR